MLDVSNLKKINEKHKTVLIRLDLNIPLNSIDRYISDRIIRIKNPILNLLNDNHKVVILSHLGRPKGKINKSLSLKQVVPQLEKVLEKKINFLPDCVGKEIKDEINSLEEGKVILLENCRFYKEEEENDHNFAKQLSELADVYVNDAFACSHRAHASIEAISHFMPSYCGDLLEEEMINLQEVIHEPHGPALTIIGGSKISTKISVLKNLSKKMDTIVIAGGMANNFLKYNGHNIQNSLHEENVNHLIKEILNFSAKNNCKLVLPIDVVTADKISDKAETKECDIDSIEEQKMILDIGKNTVKLIENEISKSKTVFWNGPLGVFETSPFDKGTVEIANFIGNLTENKEIRSFAGGGDTISALDLACVKDKFSYVSTGGGALLELIEGKKLPGLVALGIL
ncbi:phosphoglycerate kinase [Pelagibacterales bacterium SAG-MED32]|nr:phosphoglycerate kinase [Pelagibacterales bacterium SAG-MED32]